MFSRLFAPVVLSLVAALQLGAASAQDATPAPAEAASARFLFVQTFTAGRLEPGAEAGAATLTLEQPAGQTIYFSEAPARVAGLATIEQYLEVLAAAKADPPNAALVIEASDPDQDQVVIVELLRSTVDDAGAVTYDVRVLADPSALDFDLTLATQPLAELTEPIDFGTSHLFVDSGCSPMDPRDC